MMATASGVLINLQLEGAKEEHQWHCRSPDNLHYKEMEERVTDFFPACRGRILELMWIDSDGDLVTFSSDEELQQVFYGTNNGPVQMVIRDTVVDNSSRSCCECVERCGAHDGIGSVGEDMCHQCEMSVLHSDYPMDRQKKCKTSPNVGASEMLEHFWQWMQTATQDSRTDSASGMSEPDKVAEDGRMSQERKRTWQDMTEQCRRQMQELDIKRNVTDKYQNTHKGQSGGSDDEMFSEDENEGVWEDLMDEWLKENWSVDNPGGDESNGEAVWQQIMRKLHSYLSGADEHMDSTATETDAA